MSGRETQDRIIKRVFDLVSSSFAIILLFPLFLFISLWIKIEGLLFPDCAGPVFFYGNEDIPGASFLAVQVQDSAP